MTTLVANQERRPVEDTARFCLDNMGPYNGCPSATLETLNTVDGGVEYDDLVDPSPVDSSSVWEICVGDGIDAVMNIKEEFGSSGENGVLEDSLPWAAAQTNYGASLSPQKKRKKFGEILREVKVTEESLQRAVAKLGGGTQGLQVLMHHVHYWASEVHDEHVTATIMKGIVDLSMLPEPKKHCNQSTNYANAGDLSYDAHCSVSPDVVGTCEITKHGAAYTRALRKSHMVRQRGHMRAQRHQPHSIGKSCSHQSRAQWRTSTNHQWLQDLDPAFGNGNGKGYEFLFQKELRASDVSSLGRIVLPKKDAERHLPFLVVREGVMISLEDYHSGTFWTARYRFWPNNKSRMYLLENIGGFVNFHHLQEGDLLLCYRNGQGGYVIRGQRVPANVKAPLKGQSSKSVQARGHTWTTEMRTVMPVMQQFTEGESTSTTDSSDLANSPFDSLDCTLGEIGDGRSGFEEGIHTHQQSCISAQMESTFNLEDDLLKTGLAGSFRPLAHDAGYDSVVPMLSVDLKQRYSEGDLEYLGKVDFLY